MLMVKLYIEYGMSYIVCEKAKKSGIEMTLKKETFLLVEGRLNEKKSRIEGIQIL
jgi:hypothetical protein